MVRERENLIIGRPRTFKTDHLRAGVNCKVLENNYILKSILIGLAIVPALVIYV